MNRKQELLERLATHRNVLRGQFGVKELLVFGSVARDEARPDSDVDVLVTFVSTARFDQFMELKFYLEELLGARVDLVTRKALRPHMRASVEQEAVNVA